LRRSETGDLVARCATLASLLEVSAYPKPGNVHRTRDIPGTRYEHFLAGSAAIAPAMRRLAISGYDAQSGSASWNTIGIGKHVLEAIKDSLNWQSGGNVNLGVILLFAPLAAAGGSVLSGKERIDLLDLRAALKMVIRSTNAEDAEAVYEAIRLAVPSRVLGQVEELDVLDDSAPERISREGLTLLDIYQRCAHRDSICREWVSDFEITFNVGHPHLKEALARSGNINSAFVDTFLLLLSTRPDSLIQRKSGPEKALEVSQKAGLILEAGGSASERGRELLWALDEELHEAKGMLNPGTTADLTAASIFVLLLEGWRP